MKKIITLSRKITVRANMTEQRMEVTAEEMARICTEDEFANPEERREFVAAHTALCKAINPLVKAVRNFRNLAIIRYMDGSQKTVPIMNLDRPGITRALLAAVNVY